ncbi:MAG: hypothetical protein NE330_09970 [Lentisphaeraceae bacterium]|nr:hypothetical protein [Lentisphaeraceae bacterium]
MRLSIFRFPLKVEFSFAFILIIFLQHDLEQGQYELFVIKAFVIFFSLIIHELGHAFALRKFGIESEIRIHCFGGTCISSISRKLKHWQDMLVSIAGPMCDFVLAAVFFIVLLFKTNFTPTQIYVFEFIVIINVFWGIFNLIPLLPMDGGQALRSLLLHFKIKKAIPISFFVSGTLLVLCAIWAVNSGHLWNIMLVALFGWENYKLWVAHKYHIDRNKLRDLFIEWRETQNPQVLEKTIAISKNTKSPIVKYEGLLNSALLFSFMGNWQRALDYIENTQASSPLFVSFLKEVQSGSDLEESARLHLRRSQELYEQLFLLRVLLYRGFCKSVNEILREDYANLEKHLDLWNYLFTDMHYVKEYESSIELGKIIFEHTQKGAYAFNIGCSYCQLGKNDEAIKFLKVAAEKGYANLRTFQNDTDLQKLKDNPDFLALLKTLS